MPVSSQRGVDFCNNYIRTRSDLLAKEYERGNAQVNRWNALGGGATATAVMATDLQNLALFFIDNQASFVRAEIEYNEEGQLFVTAGAGVVWDNGSLTGPDPNRPNITADQAITLVTRWRERVNWLGASTATFASTTPLVVDGANLGTLVAAAHNPTVTTCGNVITRCTELKTQYEATSNARLSTILAVAVNPLP